MRLSTCCSLLTTSHYLPTYYCLLLPLATCCMCRGMQQTCNHKYSYTPLCPPETRSPPQPPPSRRRSRSLSHSPRRPRSPCAPGAGDHEALRYAPRTGSALLHAHGQRCLTHEGSEVRVFSPVSLAGAPPPFAPPTLLLRAAWLSRLRVCSCDGTVWTWCQAGRAVLRM